MAQSTKAGVLLADDCSTSGESSTSDAIKDATTMTAFGKFKTFTRLEPEEWSFVSLSVLNTCIAIGLTIERLIQLHKDTPDFTFAIILFINIVFVLYYAVHGVLREREFEIYAYIVGIVILFAYIVVDLAANDNRPTIKWVRFGFILALAPLNVYYGWRVALDFGYLEFKTVGAGLQLQRMYRQAGRFSMLLKFDVQVMLSVVVFIITDPAKLKQSDKIIIGIGVPFQVCWAVLGWILMRRENRNLVWLFVLSSLVEPAYLIFQFYKLVGNWEDNWDKSKILTICFLVAGILAFLVHGLVLLCLKYVVNNFGQGLRDQVFAVPVTGQEPALLRKRDIKKCCGVVCCGPFG